MTYDMTIEISKYDGTVLARMEHVDVSLSVFEQERAFGLEQANENFPSWEQITITVDRKP